MANTAQRSLASGELAPALWARCDTAKYATGLRTCRNMIVMRQGGANYRPGTDFDAETKDSGAAALLTFVFSNTQAFILEFGDRYIRFHALGATLESGGVPYELVSPYAVAHVGAIQFAQSGDIVTLTHPLYPVYELKRFSALNWTLTAVSFVPRIATPTGLSAIGTVDFFGHSYQFSVTAIDATTGEESLVETEPSVHAWADPTAAAPITVTLNAVPGAGSYNVYLSYDKAAPAFLVSFTNPGGYVTSVATLDPLHTPPVPFTGFSAAGDYPSCVTYYQQRRVFANTINEPEKVWCSQVGNYYNFNTSSPLQDDSAITFVLANTQVSAVQQLVDLGKLIISTDSGEWLVWGDQAGVLTPFAINARVGSYNGTNGLRQIKSATSLLYVQSLGNRILELRPNIADSAYTFDSSDLTLYASHLFDGYTILDWAYQQVPNYVTWAVRSDGTLLGFTYLPDQQLSAWHRHDTDGTFERVAVIPESGEHRVYVVVNRTIDGVTKRYIERLRSLTLTDIVESASFMDAALEYDGRNGSGTMTLSGGTTWAYDELLTITASIAHFNQGGIDDVGNAFFLHLGDELVRFTIATVDSGTVAHGFANKTVPVAMRTVAITSWDHAVDAVANLDHLEGKTVAVFADGFVVASPNNPEVTTVTVTAGVATLDQPYAHIRVGLAYLGDTETLDIDTPSGPSLKDTMTNVSRGGLFVQASRGTFIGGANPGDDDPVGDLFEMKTRTVIDYSDPVTQVTDYIEANLANGWSKGGHVFIRQVDPVPLNILAVYPNGFLPGGG